MSLMDHTAPISTSAIMPSWADPDSPDFDTVLASNWLPRDLLFFNLNSPLQRRGD